MAIIADKFYNLADYAKQFDPSGQELAIAEVLTQTNEIIADMPFTESNLEEGHSFAVRTGIPVGAWRRAYEGLPPEKGTTKVEVARPGTLGAFSVVEKIVAEKGGHVDNVRSGQAKAIFAGMSNTAATALIYGGVSQMERCVGLASYYYTLSAKKAQTARNVIDAGGKTDGKNTSIFLTVWDIDKIYGFFPKGSKAGIQRTDYGLTTAVDDNGKEYPAYKEYFEWKLGLALQDWRYAGRVANIDVDKLNETDLLGLMQDLEERIQSLTLGKPVWYMNRTVKAALRKQLGKKANVFYTPDQPSAKSIMFVDEVPVHVCDAIEDTENTVGA